MEQDDEVDEQQKANALKSFNEIVNKLKFSEVLKKQTQGEQSGLHKVPEFIYQQECDKLDHLMLPILQKVYKKSLII